MIALAIAMIVLGLLAWLGQMLAWRAPDMASRLGLMEAEDEVEAAYWADVRAEAMWDSLTLWTMVAAGVSLVLDAEAWAPLALVAGGIYVYFAGRGILARTFMGRAGLRAGSPSAVKSALIFLGIWGLLGVVAIAAASTALL